MDDAELEAELAGGDGDAMVDVGAEVIDEVRAQTMLARLRGALQPAHPRLRFGARPLTPKTRARPTLRLFRSRSAGV